MKKQKDQGNVDEKHNMAWCSWCGQWGDKDYMYLKGGQADWYHAECIKNTSKSDAEFLFGETKN